MKNESDHFTIPQNVRITLLVISLFTLIIHLYTNLFASYGIFRDEFYYIACTNHLAAGYVDQPPLSIYLLFISRLLFGDSLFAIRLLPAITAALTVYFTGLLTIRIGGGLTAVLIACITLAFSPIFLAMNTIYTMNSFDHFFWVLSAYFVVRIIQEEKISLWIILGVVIGLGMLNKISMAWFGAGLIAGIIFTPLRAQLKTPRPYIAAAIALLIFSPFIIWNVTHDFAHLEFMRNASRFKYSSLTPIDFMSGQLLLAGPLTIFVWLPGLIFLLVGRKVKQYRILGIIFLSTFLLLVINWHSKAEYLAAAYPLVYAGGGVFFERVLSGKSYEWLKYGLTGLIVVTGFIAMPMALPVLPVKTFISYSKFLGMSPQNSENKELAELPQFYADMFGWEELASDVSKVYQSLPDSEEAGTVIFAHNYGEAGALEYYSSRYKLTSVICPHNSYWYWAHPDTNKIRTIIVIGGNIEDHRSACRNVTVGTVHEARYSMPYENNLPIYICRDIYRSLEEIWRQARTFI